MKMGVVEKAKEFFFGKVDVNEASMKAGIEWLVAAGFFGTQLAGIPESDEEIISQSAKFSKAMIPFLGTRHNSWMHELIDRFLQNYEMYLYYKGIFDRIYPPEIPQINGQESSTPFARALHSINVLKDMIVSDGKIILSLTYEMIENKTIVINKGFLPDPGTNRGLSLQQLEYMQSRTDELENG